MSRIRVMMLGVIGVLAIGVITAPVSAEWGYGGHYNSHSSRHGYHGGRADAYEMSRYHSARTASRYSRPYAGPPAMPVRPTNGGLPYHAAAYPPARPVVPVAAYRPVAACDAGCAPSSAPVNVNVQAAPTGTGLEAGYYVGRGILGQPTVYAEGQPVRNFLRAFSP
ncbi:MAG: hypothetical protein KDB23_08990 [Planctomycetales bacterium]|nr:hypothetical protein [Planctomycetales bacterium]